MTKLTVITREVSPMCAKCELTHIARQPIHYERVVEQHDAYVAIFEKLLKEGYDVELIKLAAVADYPDSMFVEDVAVIYDGCAIVTRCGAESRRGENAAIKRWMEFVRPGNVHVMTAPAHTDGGDIFPVGRYIFVGESTRTNDEAFAQMRAFMSKYSFIDEHGDRHPYECVRLPVKGMLHTKTAGSFLNDLVVLMNTKACDASYFTSRGIEVIAAPEGEGDGSNPLSFVVSKPDGSMRKRVIVLSDGFPRTHELVSAFAKRETAAGRTTEVLTTPMDEIAKAEGSLTCLSLLCYHKGAARSE